MEIQQKWWIILALVILLLWFFSSKETLAFPNPLQYDFTKKNDNAFGNYYRIGSENSRNLGWKPSLTWNFLRPEANECPECFDKDPLIELKPLESECTSM